MSSRLMRWNNNQRGMVSIFIVIFTALLISVICISFIRLMIQAQQQAIATDLSQSAHDSAQAGVEDAKRLLVMYQTKCVKDPNPAEAGYCARLKALLDGSACNAIQKAGVAGNNDDEVLVEQSDGDKVLQQAYTCVKISLDTDDYIGAINTNTSRIVPLRATTEFDQVVVEWFSQNDLSDSSNSPGEKTVDLVDGLQLPRLSEWPKNRPSLLRAQLIQMGPSFDLASFDTGNARTLFLYPNATGTNGHDFRADTRQSHTASVLRSVDCDENFSTTSINKNFACSATLTLPSLVKSTDTAYLRLSPIYNELTNFSVKMKNTSPSAPRVQFKNVQPIVDSTGRANDIFRRVQSRVSLENDTFPYPENAIDVTGNLCKTFLVTDTYYHPGSCAP